MKFKKGNGSTTHKGEGQSMQHHKAAPPTRAERKQHHPKVEEEGSSTPKKKGATQQHSKRRGTTTTLPYTKKVQKMILKLIIFEVFCILKLLIVQRRKIEKIMKINIKLNLFFQNKKSGLCVSLVCMVGVCVVSVCGVCGVCAV